MFLFNSHEQIGEVGRKVKGQVKIITN